MPCLQVGLPDVSLSGPKTAKNQKGALIASADGILTHTPSPDSECYTQDGYDSQFSSNIALGIRGSAAIDGYMDDFGDNNVEVGHRRWFVYPRLGEVGIGDVGSSGDMKAGSVWVIGDFEARPSSPSYIAWPPAGYVPYQLMPTSKRWSLSWNNANFASATVSVRDAANKALSVTVTTRGSGAGDAAIVFEVNNYPGGRPLAGDLTYSVSIKNIVVDASTQDVEYIVRVLDTNPPGTCWLATSDIYRTSHVPDAGETCEEVQLAGRSGINSFVNDQYTFQRYEQGIPIYE